jgi:hypothetical protein
MITLAVVAGVGGTAPLLAGSALIDGVSFLCLYYCYFIFSLMRVSLRFRMLSMIRSSRGISVSDLKRKFDAEELLNRRLDRLLRGGHIGVEEGHFVVTPTFLQSLATLNNWLKRALLSRASEWEKL